MIEVSANVRTVSNSPKPYTKPYPMLYAASIASNRSTPATKNAMDFDTDWFFEVAILQNLFEVDNSMFIFSSSFCDFLYYTNKQKIPHIIKRRLCGGMLHPVRGAIC